MSSQQTTPQTSTQAVRLKLDGLDLDLGRGTSSCLAGSTEPVANSEYLDEAVCAIEKTLAEGGYTQPSVLASLGAVLYQRFERTGSLDGLNRSIDAIAQAIDTTSEGNSDQALYLSTLGLLLGKRRDRTASVRDLTLGTEVLDPSVDFDNDDIPSIITGALEGETIYANTPQHHGMVLLLQMSDESGIVPQS
ncbi:hypothetical protein ACEPPN_000847 [Leptodophora sp. 'Broadleaf-Isolate-01']